MTTTRACTADASQIGTAGAAWDSLNILGKTIAPLIDQQMTWNFKTSQWLEKLQSETKRYAEFQDGADLTLSLKLLLKPEYIDLLAPIDTEKYDLISGLISKRNVWAHANENQTLQCARHTIADSSKLLHILGMDHAAKRIELRHLILDNIDDDETAVHFDATPHPIPILKPAEHRICLRLRGLTPTWQDNLSTVVGGSARLAVANGSIGVVDEKVLIVFSADDGVVSDWSPIRATGSLVPPALEWQGYLALLEADEQHSYTLAFRSPHHGDLAFAIDMPPGEISFTRHPFSWIMHTQAFDVAGNSRSTDPSDYRILTVDRNGTISSILDRSAEIMCAPPSAGRDATHHLLAMRQHRVALGTSVPGETWILDLDTSDLQWTGGSRHTLTLDGDGHFLLRDGLIHAFTADGALRWTRSHHCTKLLGTYGETLLAATEQGDLLGLNIYDPNDNWIQCLQPEGGRILFTAGDGLIASWDHFTCQIRSWKDGTTVASVDCPRGSIRDVQILSDTRLAMLFNTGVLTVFSVVEDVDAVLQLTV